MSISDTVWEANYRKMQRTLEDIAQEVRDLGADATVLMFPGPTGPAGQEISGECRVFSLPRGLNPRKVLLRMSRGQAEQATGTYASIRLIRPSRKDEPVSGHVFQGRRWVGLLDTYWFRASRHRRLSELILTAADIEESSRAKRRRKVELIAYRMVWTPDGIRPKRGER